jgi:hypothetical protein
MEVRMNEQTEHWVRRDDLHRTEMRHGTPSVLGPGDVRLAVRRFALTANNFTYAALGDRGGFWRVFPAPAPWGRIPVWGCAEVVESRHGEIPVGTLVFGMLAMATQVVLQAQRVTAHGFVDAAAHRRELCSIYNQYAREALGDLHVVLRPLFYTSFVIDDHIAEHDGYGARTVLLSSASSKTALGAAFLLRARGRMQVCGLTAARHHRFVSDSGCYDTVLAYDDVDALDVDPPVVHLDFAGDAALLQRLQRRLGGGLVRTLFIGGTHGTAPGGVDMPGVAIEHFFGPAHILARRERWGADVLRRRYAVAESRFLTYAREWLEVERCNWSQLESSYHRVHAGSIDPARGVVVELGQSADRRDACDAATAAEERAARSWLTGDSSDRRSASGASHRAGSGPWTPWSDSLQVLQRERMVGFKRRADLT